MDRSAWTDRSALHHHRSGRGSRALSREDKEDRSAASHTCLTNLPDGSRSPSCFATGWCDGDDCTLTALSLGVHSGTHMDAPLHFIRTGRGLNAMPLSAAMGPARVIEILDRESIKPDILRAHRLKRGRTGSVQDPHFFPRLEDKPLSPKLRLSQRRGRSVVGRASCTHGRDRLLVGRRLCLGHRRHSLRAAQGGDLNHRGIESVEGPARAPRIALPTDQDGAVRRCSRPCAPESPARQAPDQIRPSVKEGHA
jgi:hypothetical protein